MYEQIKDEKDEGDYYLQALEIVQETCEWVLAQEHPEQFSMIWSG